MEVVEWDEGWEATLVVAARAGDLGAFDSLVRRYRPALVVLASQILRTRDQAEDAAQDAFLAAYAALPQLQDPSRFGAWLGTIARHRARRLAMGQRREVVPIDAVILSYTPALAEKAAANDDRKAIRCALDRLPGEILPVVELYYLDEWSVREIASLLDLPITTVKWRLHTGRKLLRNLLPDLEEENERELL
ncbi:RNA polymerase sigma factor [Fimbriimonas ginsengisoli]|uniref:RNA polymerase sigma factor SigW-like protein n=1 Tax=Fimbriimonas ginsengisoli Gsoil 348 TaxID=661478 RepID=A0A068NUU6_FIMGI|nr:sigma-70 family RNA polymerase sigma factor [Fimbriimonas ginsengisoli]AIE87112.1 RNA polymerase sigma factor SigW-like protein [Fimbriimonas ginsengisoli Gsoil 348]